MKLLIVLLLPILLLATEITPIPLSIEYDKKKAELGRKLFFDPILSKDNTISCSSCHNFPGNGANLTQYSFGVDGAEGSMNTPTVLNSVFNFVQFWNGRAKDLKEQALEPIQNPVEMASKLEDVIKKLNNSSYKSEFDEIYEDGVTEDNLADAIAEFEIALITPNSRFDQYLRGDENAITAREKKGYEKFKDFGCISCHNGVAVGGNMYQVTGLVGYYKQDKPVNGRYDITKRERDRNVYKVPSLRNVEKTAPYFHDGQEESLSGAIDKMQIVQLGIEPKKEDTELIESFLKTLSGEMPEILQGHK